MKKFLTLMLTLIVALTACLGLTACGGGDDNKYDRTVTMGFDAGFPPYGYEDPFTGEFKGFDIEYAKKVCKNLNYKLVLKPIDWGAKDAMLDSGAIDFIWNGFTYEGREDGYTWTDRYLDNSIVVLTKNSSINSLSALTGKKVAVQSESSGESALKKNTALTSTFSGGTYSLEADYTVACEKLMAGAYDALIIDIGVAKFLKKNNASLIIVDEIVASETYGVGFKKGNTELRDIFNTEINNVAKDTAFVKGLCNKYGIQYESFLLGK